MSQLDRQTARDIVCDAFNAVANTHIPATEEGESTVVQQTLEDISIDFRRLIYDKIKHGLPDGCTSTLGANGFLLARYVDIESVVEDFITSADC